MRTTVYLDPQKAILGACSPRGRAVSLCPGGRPRPAKRGSVKKPPLSSQLQAHIEDPITLSRTDRMSGNYFSFVLAKGQECA